MSFEYLKAKKNIYFAPSFCNIFTKPKTYNLVFGMCACFQQKMCNLFYIKIKYCLFKKGNKTLMHKTN